VTDEQWLHCDEAPTLLDALRPHATDQQLRLIASACCRYLRRTLDDPTAASAIGEVIGAVERYTDGAGTKAALKRARQAVRAVRHASPVGAGEDSTAWCALWVAEVAASENACEGVISEVDRLVGLGLLGGDKVPPMCDWLRCVFGPPSHSRVIETTWRSPEVIKLARSIEVREVSGLIGEARRGAPCGGLRRSVRLGALWLPVGAPPGLLGTGCCTRRAVTPGSPVAEAEDGDPACGTDDRRPPRDIINPLPAARPFLPDGV
jgi:hypothetical protein